MSIRDGITPIDAKEREAQREREKLSKEEREARRKEKAKAVKKEKKRVEQIEKLNANHQFLVGLDMPAFLQYYQNNHITGENPRKAAFQPKNYTSIIGDNAIRTRSHLLGVKGMESFINMDTAKLSSLVPSIRLFQEKRDIKGKTIGNPAEIVFEDFQGLHQFSDINPDSITSDRNMRGSGAGVKEISIDMEGDSIATADRMYKVQMKLYFSSLHELFKNRLSPNGERYQYVDLFKLLSRDPTKAKKEGNQELKILRLEYGYHEPSDSTIWDQSRDEKLIEAIRDAKRVISLNLYKHNLEYNENGSINLDLEYHGYTERRVTKVDVFELGMTKKEREKARELYEEIREKKSAPSDSDSKKDEEQKEKDEKSIKEDLDKMSELRKKGYSSFFAKLAMEKMIYFTRYAAEKGKNEPLLRLSDSKGHHTNSLSDSILSIEKSSTVTDWTKGGSKRLPRQAVSFFYLGDLLDIVIGLAKEEVKSGFEFAFGSFYYKEKEDSKSYEVPISAIPVSEPGFRKWFEENVLEKSERQSYDLSSFLKDIVQLALRSFSPEFRSVTSTRAPSKPQIRSQSFNTSKPIPKGQIKDVYSSGQIPNAILKNNIYQKGLIEHYYVYGVNAFAELPRCGNYVEDSKDGIYHLVAASENGVTKKVKYSKADTKYLAEMRMVSDGFNDKKRILWSLYKANVDMVGNPIFKPGMLVYITSNSFAQQDADDLGLGGYFMVLKVRNTIQDGKFSTELETIWTKPTKPGA